MGRGLRFCVAALLMASPGAAQVLEFSPKEAKDFDASRAGGACTIRIRIDSEANIYMQGRMVRVEPLPDKSARDEGSECNQYLPESGLSGFQFKALDGHGETLLVEEPAPGNQWRVWVRIRDKKGRVEVHSFRIGWKPA